MEKSPRPSILLVDDDPEELELLEAALAPIDAETVRAADYQEALALLGERRFDAAVLDLVMPRLNGFETAALLRSSANGRDMPILILTGYDERGSRRLPGWETARGLVDYVEKPFAAQTLLDRLAAYSPALKRSSGLAPRA